MQNGEVSSVLLFYFHARKKQKARIQFGNRLSQPAQTYSGEWQTAANLKRRA